jgi:hypothetical protein
MVSVITDSACDNKDEWIIVDEETTAVEGFLVPVCIQESAWIRCIEGVHLRHAPINEAERQRRIRQLMSTIALNAQINFAATGYSSQRATGSFEPFERFIRSEVHPRHDYWVVFRLNKVERQGQLQLQVRLVSSGDALTRPSWIEPRDSVPCLLSGHRRGECSQR